MHSALVAGGTAVITGAASGIGLATAKKFAAMGMTVCITDITDVALQAVAHEVNEAASPNSTVLSITADVSDSDTTITLAATVRQEFGDVAFLMNNAVTRIDAQNWENVDALNRSVAVNIMGVVI